MLGQTISHYRIVGRLGAGGMGEVFEAEDLRLGRRVALKVLPAGARGDAEARARLEREARAASGLDHPNVGVVHEIGEAEDGALFIAMARYEGETLRALLEAGPLDVERAVGLVRQVAEGLGAAHRAGVVHRDVKPENVVVTAGGVAKVIDFGVATVAGAETLTEPGAVSGSAHYMSPEQARGERVDARADVWALGVVLYEVLAGRRPFEGSYAQAVLYQAAYEEPPSLRALRPDVPEGVARTATRALAKDPADRYPDAGAFLEALDGGASAADPAGGGGRGERRRWRVRPGAVAGVAALGAIAAAAVWASAGPDAASPYEAGRTELREYHDAARVDLAAVHFEEALAEDPSLAEAEAALGEAYVYKGRDLGDTTWARRARARAGRALELDPRLAAGHVTLGLVSLWEGDAHAAVRAFEVAQRLGAGAEAWRGLSEAYLALGEAGAAETAARRAVRADSGWWAGHDQLAKVSYSTGDYAGAAGAWERATAASPSNTRVLSNWGAALFALDRFGEAQGVFQRLVAVRPDRGAHANLGTAYFYEGRYVEAAAQYERALRYVPGDAEMLGYLAASYEQVPGREGRSREAYAEAAAALRAEPGWERDPVRVSELATYLAALGQDAEARALVASASAPPPESVYAMVNLAATYARLGEGSAVRRWACAALRAGYSPRVLGRTPALVAYRSGAGGWGACVDREGDDA